jgi:hypothetical protein
LFGIGTPWWWTPALFGTGLLLLFRGPIKTFILFLWDKSKTVYNFMKKCVQYYKNKGKTNKRL